MTPYAFAAGEAAWLDGLGLGQDLLSADTLHVVNLAGVLLHALHELLLIVSLEHPTTFTLDSLLHLTPWSCPAWQCDIDR